LLECHTTRVLLLACVCVADSLREAFPVLLKHIEGEGQVPLLGLFLWVTHVATAAKSTTITFDDVWLSCVALHGCIEAVNDFLPKNAKEEPALSGSCIVQVSTRAVSGDVTMRMHFFRKPKNGGVSACAGAVQHVIHDSLAHT
jgi:hypothetical protein